MSRNPITDPRAGDIFNSQGFELTVVEVTEDTVIYYSSGSEDSGQLTYDKNEWIKLAQEMNDEVVYQSPDE